MFLFRTTLGVFTVITKLSKGRMAFSKQRSFLRKLFPKKKIPSGSSKEKHAFTSYDIFTGYAKNKKGIFSQATFTKDLQSWAEYLEFLSGGKHKKQQVITTLLKLYDKKPVDAAKWLKNKVQSYEVGQVVDKAQSQIADLVKTNIMKSVYSQAESKRNKIVREMESFKKGNPNLSQFKELKTIKQQNKAMGKGFEVVEDMNMLYYYNQFVDKNYKSGDCVPISLKKVVA